MALLDFALRICAVRALRGATYCGDRVFDSEILPADQSEISQKSTPFISVYTDAGRVPNGSGRDLLASDRQIDLTFEVIVSKPVVADEEQGLAIPQTDAALEAQLNFIGRQIHRALLAPGSAWADLFKQFWTKISRVEEFRGANSQSGLRFAARQVVLTLDVLAEPSFSAPKGPWVTLLAQMRQDASLLTLADILEAEITSPAIPDWQAAVADLGITTAAWEWAGMTNVGGAPEVIAEEDAADAEADIDANAEFTVE